MYNEVRFFVDLFSSLTVTHYPFHLQSDFPNPRTFNPDRFLLNGKLNPDVPNPGVMLFGYGKRLAIFKSRVFNLLSPIAFTACVLGATLPFELSGVP